MKIKRKGKDTTPRPLGPARSHGPLPHFSLTRVCPAARPSTRPQPNAGVEVVEPALGFAMLLTLIAVLTFSDPKKVISEHSEAPASSVSTKKKPAP